jgi:site-specific recombinase XerD
MAFSTSKIDQAPRQVVEDLNLIAFLTDCQIRNLAPRTLAIYRRHLGDLASWLRKPLSEASIDDLRAYFLALRERRNPGGQHQRSTVGLRRRVLSPPTP